MHFIYQENPFSIQVILTKDEVNDLRVSIEHERNQENEFALSYYGLLYEYPEDVDGELRKMICHLQGTHQGDCVSTPAECLKCTAENHLGISTLRFLEGINKKHIKTAFWHIRTALEENKGNLLQAIEYLEERSKDWDGRHIYRSAIEICKEHLEQYVDLDSNE